MRRTITAGVLAAMAAAAMAFGAGAEKRALGHGDFDNWKGVTNYSVSRDGAWAAYAVNPQEGDGELFFRNVKTGKSVMIPRGYKPQFTADGKYGVALIKPQYAKTRKAKIAKKKDHEMPTDSLAMVDLETLKVEKVADVKSYKLGRDGGDWVRADG